MEELNLTEGHTYLIRYGSTDTLHKIKVLTITDKAYEIRWQSNNVTWELKKRMNLDYSLVEDISDFEAKEQQKNFDGTFTFTESLAVEYETCPVCHGTGTVPNSQTTAAFVTCPLCQGNRRVVKRTEVKQ